MLKRRCYSGKTSDRTLSNNRAHIPRRVIYMQYLVFAIGAGQLPACRKGLQTIRALESPSKVAWSAGVSRCRAQNAGWACGMQIRLFREHKHDAALKCEIQHLPTNFSNGLARTVAWISVREYLQLLSSPSRDDQRAGLPGYGHASGSEVSPPGGVAVPLCLMVSVRFWVRVKPSCAIGVIPFVRR